MIVQHDQTLGRAIEDVTRLQHIPTPDMEQGLNGALRAAFMDTQERTHVLTGRLKASGRMSSEAVREGWHGEIAYGGTPGTEQAVYETAQGGAHDFLAGLPAYDEDFERAIDQAIRRAAR